MDQEHRPAVPLPLVFETLRLEQRCPLPGPTPAGRPLGSPWTTARHRPTAGRGQSTGPSRGRASARGLGTRSIPRRPVFARRGRHHFRPTSSVILLEATAWVGPRRMAMPARDAVVHGDASLPLLDLPRALAVLVSVGYALGL